MRPLDWWAANRDKYPVLSIIVQKYLQIPATSAPSEQFFSLGALVINKLRNRISKETFEKIMALKSWGFTIDTEAEDLAQVQRAEGNEFFIEPVD